jgi:hypothetical protein
MALHFAFYKGKLLGDGSDRSSFHQLSRDERDLFDRIRRKLPAVEGREGED